MKVVRYYVIEANTLNEVAESVNRIAVLGNQLCRIVYVEPIRVYDSDYRGRFERIKYQALVEEQFECEHEWGESVEMIGSSVYKKVVCRKCGALKSVTREEGVAVT